MGNSRERAMAVMSAMKGCTPNSMVSETGSSFEQNSVGPAAQPLRKPGAACDLEIDETTIVRSANSGMSNGEAKAGSANTRTRKSDGEGKRGTGRVARGGRRSIRKNKIDNRA